MWAVPKLWKSAHTRPIPHPARPGTPTLLAGLPPWPPAMSDQQAGQKRPNVPTGPSAEEPARWDQMDPTGPSCEGYLGGSGMNQSSPIGRTMHHTPPEDSVRVQLSQWQFSTGKRRVAPGVIVEKIQFNISGHICTRLRNVTLRSRSPPLDGIHTLTPTNLPLRLRCFVG